MDLHCRRGWPALCPGRAPGMSRLTDSGGSPRKIPGREWRPSVFDVFGARSRRRPKPSSPSRLAHPDRGKPVDDATYRIFAALQAYDKTPLDAKVQEIDDSSPYWRRETITFPAAYGGERMMLHLFLPRNARHLTRWSRSLADLTSSIRPGCRTFNFLSSSCFAQAAPWSSRCSAARWREALHPSSSL